MAVGQAVQAVGGEGDNLTAVYEGSCAGGTGVASTKLMVKAHGEGTVRKIRRTTCTGLSPQLPRIRDCGRPETAEPPYKVPLSSLGPRYMKKLQNSGFNQQYRKEILTSALNGFKNKKKLIKQE